MYDIVTFGEILIDFTDQDSLAFSKGIVYNIKKGG